MRNRIAQAQGIPVEEVFLCDGCRPLEGRAPGAGGDSVCETYACSLARGVEFCYQCADFPCTRIAPCADRAQEIPNNTKVYHLVLLEKEGIDTWLKNYPERMRQYRRGKKPKAGGPIQL